MSNSLAQQHCEPCVMGTRPLPSDEVNRLLPSIGRWKKLQVDAVDRLQRDYHFRDFRDAFAFATKVATLAEHENHHPSMTVEWGMVRVSWWTHKVNGLHINDFIMAAKTDALITRTD